MNNALSLNESFLEGVTLILNESSNGTLGLGGITMVILRKESAQKGKIIYQNQYLAVWVGCICCEGKAVLDNN